MTHSIVCWHFRLDPEQLRHTGERVVPGEWLRLEGPIAICQRGYHGSRRAIDALTHGPGACVALIELRGDVQEDPKKVCARERRELGCLSGAQASRLLRLFACFCAARALRAVHATDSRSWAAVRVAARHACGRASDDELAAAHAAGYAAYMETSRYSAAAFAAAEVAAAEAAACTASFAASTAYAAIADTADALAAARAAASASVGEAAAFAATYAAYAGRAARPAERERQNAKLESMLWRELRKGTVLAPSAGGEP